MRESAFSKMRKSQKAWPCARIGVPGDAKASLSAASGRSGLGAVSAPGPLARQRRGFARIELRGRRRILARSGADFVAGAALSQGQLFSRLELRGRRSTFEMTGAVFVAGAVLSQHISWQAQHFHKVMYRFRGRCSTFARSSENFVAGAALLQGQLSQLGQLLSTKVVREVHFRSRGSNIATFKYESSTRSPLSQLGLKNRNF